MNQLASTGTNDKENVSTNNQTSKPHTKESRDDLFIEIETTQQQLEDLDDKLEDLDDELVMESCDPDFLSNLKDQLKEQLQWLNQEYELAVMQQPYTNDDDDDDGVGGEGTTKKATKQKRKATYKVKNKWDDRVTSNANEEPTLLWVLVSF